MHFNLFDPYQRQASLIHRCDPRMKLVVVILFILTVVLLPDGAWLGYLFAWMLILLGLGLAHLRLGYLLRRSALALPFGLAAVTVMFTLPGEVLTSGSIGSWQWSITDAGLVRTVSILLASWLSVQAAVLLTATTPFPDILHGLRHLYLPKPLVAIVAFMYRYLFLLADEALRLLRARESRSAHATGLRPGRSIVWRAGVTGNLAGQLFIRSYERGERVYNAMLARGFSGEFLTITPHRVQRGDWVFGGCAAGLLVLALGIGYLTWL